MVHSDGEEQYEPVQQEDNSGVDLEIGDAPVQLQTKQGLIYPLWRLLKTNKRFRLLWMSNVVSLFGDWYAETNLCDQPVARFNEVATVTVLQQNSENSAVYVSGTHLRIHSCLTVIVLLTIRLVVPAIMLLVGGIAADKFDRRVVMVWADTLRCLV